MQPNSANYTTTDRGREVWRWHYTDHTYVARYEDEQGIKTVIPHLKVDGRAGYADGLRPLFGQWSITDDWVAITEGEKAAAAFHAFDHPAVTSPGGCKAANKANWLPVLQSGAIYLFPDNDDAGARYVLEVINIVRALPSAPPMYVFQFPSAPKGGDVVDWLQAMPELFDWDGYTAEPLQRNKLAIYRRFGEVLACRG